MKTNYLIFALGMFLVQAVAHAEAARPALSQPVEGFAAELDRLYEQPSLAASPAAKVAVRESIGPTESPFHRYDLVSLPYYRESRTYVFAFAGFKGQFTSDYEMEHSVEGNPVVSRWLTKSKYGWAINADHRFDEAEFLASMSR